MIRESLTGGILEPRPYIRLTDEMCFLAGDTVRHYWTDIAVHDRLALANMDPGTCVFWGFGELGSRMVRLFCDCLTRSDKCPDAESISMAYKDHQWYIVRKGDTEFDGSIEPTTASELISLLTGAYV